MKVLTRLMLVGLFTCSLMVLGGCEKAAPQKHLPPHPKRHPMKITITMKMMAITITMRMVQPTKNSLSHYQLP